MIQVRFLKSAATQTASYGKGSVAWLGEKEAASLQKAGIIEAIIEQPEPMVLVQKIEKQQTRKRKK